MRKRFERYMLGELLAIIGGLSMVSLVSIGFLMSIHVN